MQLRFMTYNILDGAQGREHLIVEVLKAVKPDVVVLQEVSSPQLVEHFANNLSLYPVFSRGNSSRHIALLSKLPVVSHRSYTNFPLRTSLLEASIEYAPGKLFNVYGTHLQAHYWMGFELWRLWEINTILRRAPVTNRNLGPSLIVGDFNAVAPDDLVDTSALPLRFRAILLLQGTHIFRAAIRKLSQSGYTDCYRLAHPNGNGFTLPTPNPHVRLDYIFANDRMKDGFLDCRVVRDLPATHHASDHYPLIADFQL